MSKKTRTRNQEFYKRLRDIREEAAISQTNLANKLDMARSTISNWERGRNEPSLDDLVAISDLFQISVDDLIGSHYKLPDDERDLLLLFHRLNNEGRQQVLTLVQMATLSGLYKPSENE